jgi:hypothetical protein
MSGGGKVLKQYGIEVEDTATPMEALAILQDKVGGQATQFAGTFAGASEILKQQVGELTEKIGGALLPVLTNIATKVTPIIEKVIAWAEANPQLTQNIVLATGALAGLLLVLAPIALAFSAISAPLLIAVGALGALGFAIFKIIQNWEQIKPLIDPTLQTFKQVALVVGDFLKPAFDFLVLSLKLLWTQLKALWDILSPVLLPVLKVVAIFLGATLVAGIAILVGAIGTVAFVVAGFIKGLQLLIDKLANLILWFKEHVPQALQAFQTKWASVWEGIKSTTTAVTDYIQKKIQKIIDLWNKAKDIAGSVGGGLKDAGKAVKDAVGSLAGKAGGGAVTAGTSYVVGEKGAEVFTPTQNGTIIPNNKLGGGGGITVNINGGTYLSEDVAKQIGDKIISQFRRTVRI